MTTSMRLCSALNVSNSTSCEKARGLLRGRRRAPTVVGNWQACFHTRYDVRDFVGGQARVLLKGEYSAARMASDLSRAPQAAKDEKLRIRSLRDDNEDPSVSTERTARPTSDVHTPDISGGVVALGKFDALHVGHWALAEQAATMGTPILLSFSGMADVLGWEKRLPVAAFCDRRRIMAIWARKCGGVTPEEYAIEFVKVRTLSPREFVQKLSKELLVKGVVAGANYRFGYKAAGDASDLVHLCSEYGLQSFIVDPVMDGNEKVVSMNGELSGSSREKGQISSTRVRKALAMGNMERVTDLLGRKHRLVLKLDNSTKESDRLVIPVRSALNQYPGEGLYACSLIGTGEHVNGGVAGGPDSSDSLDGVLIGTSQVKIGPAWIEIPLGGDDIEVVLQRKLLGVEFSQL